MYVYTKYIILNRYITKEKRNNSKMQQYYWRILLQNACQIVYN